MFEVLGQAREGLFVFHHRKRFHEGGEVTSLMAFHPVGAYIDYGNSCGSVFMYHCMFSVDSLDSILRIFDKICSRRAVYEYFGLGEQDIARTFLLEMVFGYHGRRRGVHVQRAGLPVRLYVDMAPDMARQYLLMVALLDPALDFLAEVGHAIFPGYANLGRRLEHRNEFLH